VSTRLWHLVMDFSAARLPVVLLHFISTKLNKTFCRRNIARQLADPVEFRGPHDLIIPLELQLPLLQSNTVLDGVVVLLHRVFVIRSWHSEAILLRSNLGGLKLSFLSQIHKLNSVLKLFRWETATPSRLYAIPEPNMQKGPLAVPRCRISAVPLCIV
jgi:hypothetical protein